ncbi:MAG TPA: putative Ig domain-containing protein [Candidatus Saccharibacteria bacterium]|nr:putative Ig domain-containing protein [Candidatus Saccharibacteria bacterium]
MNVVSFQGTETIYYGSAELTSLWLGTFPLWKSIPIISGTPILIGTEGDTYAGFTVDATKGDGVYTFSLVGVWPNGISINSITGEISGTPTEAGTFENLSVKVIDGNGSIDTLDTFTIVIDDI